LLGFILSKLNLLILVVAIFAIVSFFAFGLKDLVLINEARLLLDRVSQKSFALVSSPSYCFSDAFDLPGQIRVAGEDYYYILKISKVEINKPTPEDPSAQISVVIFSLHPRLEYLKYFNGERAEEPPSIAASSFRTAAEVNLYSEPYTGEEYQDTDPEIATPIIVDPSTRDRYNTVEFLKEIRGGQTFVYIFPCSSSVTHENCEAVKQEVSYAACLESCAGDSTCRSNCPSPQDPDVWFGC